MCSLKKIVKAVLAAACLLTACGTEPMDLNGEITESFKSDYLEIEPFIPEDDTSSNASVQVAEYIKVSETDTACDYRFKEIISSYFYALQTGNEDLFRYVIYPQYERILEIQSEYNGTSIAVVINRERSTYGTNFKISECVIEKCTEADDYTKGYIHALKNTAESFESSLQTEKSFEEISVTDCIINTSAGESYFTELITVFENDRYYIVTSGQIKE